MVCWLKQMAHDQEIGCWFKPRHRRMDVSNNASYYIKKIENKGSQMGHTKKIILKNQNCDFINEYNFQNTVM
jgi:hypothetical protein